MGKYLIVQIPCYNEEGTLPAVLEDIIEIRQKGISGIDKFEIQIIDDGSTDKTVEIAKKYKVDYILLHQSNKGLGMAFKTGAENAIRLNADILINTDGDHQYFAKDIPRLVKPIIEENASIVTGNRQTATIKHFSIIKKSFQWLGSFAVRTLTGSKVKDAVSGYRAYSKDALIELNVTSRFSYVLDTIVQAENKKLKIVEINIDTNKPTRSSRLFKNIFQHIKKSAANLLTVFLVYNSSQVFITISGLTFVSGVYLILRYLYFYFVTNTASGHIQSLLLAIILFSVAMNCFIIFLLSILVTKNREMTEDILSTTKKYLIRKD